MKVPTTGGFTISGGDSAFANRQKQLFDQLIRAEKDCNKDQQSAIQLNDVVESKTFLRPPPPGKCRRNETRQFRRKESIFKLPALPSPFTDRSVPDHHRNPHKWLKYSLDDVKNDDMSDETNTSVALSFLSELRARKSKTKVDDEIKMEVNCPDRISTGLKTCSSLPSVSEILFKKPTNKQEKNESLHINQNEKAMFRGSKIIQSEYVVGQKPVSKNKEKRNVQRNDCHKQLKLSHLEEFNEDE